MHLTTTQHLDLLNWQLERDERRDAEARQAAQDYASRKRTVSLPVVYPQPVPTPGEPAVQYSTRMQIWRAQAAGDVGRLVKLNDKLAALRAGKSVGEALRAAGL